MQDFVLILFSHLDFSMLVYLADFDYLLSIFLLFEDLDSFLMSPKPPHLLQTSNSPGLLGNFPFPLQTEQKTILYCWGLKVLPIATLSPFPASRVWHLAHNHQFPVLQNHLVNNLPADNTFPSPKVFKRPVKFIKNHDTTAPKTLHKNILL